MNNLEVSTATAAAERSAEPVFFAVSITKLVILCICTFGIYEMYWFYKNWQLVKARERSNISPMWRTFFVYFFCYALFKKVNDKATEVGATPFAPVPLAAGWIILNLLFELADPYWLVALAAVIFMVPVQRAANEVNRSLSPGADPNTRFTNGNIAAAVAGALLLVFTIFGSLLLPA